MKKTTVFKVDFGHIAMFRGVCPKCGQQSFIMDGQYVGCRHPAEKPIYYRVQREVEGEKRRYPLSPTEKKEILDRQNYHCIYCGIHFGDWVYCPRRGLKIPRIEFDHFVCWSYSGNSHASNMVAACGVCNQLKSHFLFDDLEEARQFIANRRLKKGYENVESNLPEVSLGVS